jgi:hypothetical protein
VKKPELIWQICCEWNWLNMHCAWHCWEIKPLTPKYF